MSPRTGRPTNDPKINNTRIRLSDADVQRLEYAARVLELTRAEVIRRGIKAMYALALEKDKK